MIEAHSSKYVLSVQLEVRSSSGTLLTSTATLRLAAFGLHCRLTIFGATRHFHLPFESPPELVEHDTDRILLEDTAPAWVGFVLNERFDSRHLLDTMAATIPPPAFAQEVAPTVINIPVKKEAETIMHIPSAEETTTRIKICKFNWIA